MEETNRIKLQLVGPTKVNAQMLFIKFIVIIMLMFIMVSLFSGLFFLVKDKGTTRRTVNALTFRISLSILTILIIMGAAALGIIEFNPRPL